MHVPAVSYRKLSSVIPSRYTVAVHSIATDFPLPVRYPVPSGEKG